MIRMLLRYCVVFLRARPFGKIGRVYCCMLVANRDMDTLKADGSPWFPPWHTVIASVFDAQAFRGVWGACDPM